jgi:lysyl-tRNA synthetase class 1
MFWADKLVDDLKDKKSIWVDDMATPSGRAHVGTLRGAIIHDVAAKALSMSGIPTKYTFVTNDMDPMDGLPSYLDQKIYSQYMGLPMFKIPAPEGEGNFSDYYMGSLYSLMKALGCDFTPIKDSDEYKKGTFDKVIKIALDNADKIREIYKNVSGSDKGSDWIPFQPICEECGKIGTTRSYAWDGKMVSYRCEENMVEWAKGCGYEGKVTPYMGTGKLAWKVEWPAHWAALGINVEGEGKDHSSAGGSRDLANHLCKEVFMIDPPYDIPYEHIIFGGKKMSKSKGIGISAQEIYESLSPEIIRFLMIRHPDRVIDLDISGMVLPTLYDEYDKAASAFRGEIDFPDLSKAFLYSQHKDDFNKGFRPRFTKLAHALQMPLLDIHFWAEEEKGNKLDKFEVEDLEDRCKFVKIWLDKYAPADFKFEIQKSIPKVDLSDNQTIFINRLSKVFATKKSWTGKELYVEFGGIMDEMRADGEEIKPIDCFRAIYLIFLGKDSGPVAGDLLASLDHNFVEKRFTEI